MNFSWTFFIDLGILSLGLLLATFARYHIRFLQKYLIPNALTAGFILLPFYNFIAPALGLSQDNLGQLVYHLLNISFISMTLRGANGTGRQKNHNIISTSVGIISQYAIQAIVGLLLTFVFTITFLPDLFPAFGILLPLGFALGPGQAFAIGQGWESMGFFGAGSLGLTFAAIGFLFACFGGVFLINYGIRKGWVTEKQEETLLRPGVRRGILGRKEEHPIGSRLTTETEAIDSMSLNIAYVGGVYLLSYLLLKFLTVLLSLIGPMGYELAVNLWGINFIFSALVAMFVKFLLSSFNIHHTLDEGTLTRISGMSVDLMVVAAIGAISLVVVTSYWLPILIICIAGGVLALVTVPWISSRIFTDHRFHRTLIIFGAATGTMPTGLALLRVIDPEFATPVASDYVYASGITFALMIPFILCINLPAYSATQNNPLLFWATLGVSFGYLLFVIISFSIIAKKRAFSNANSVWLHKKR
ncbi:MAG: sodium:glutamate symporter [Spirochaetales bacterium]|nr:sodium:glutamate symporter [Spirochaetales bacterium]